MSHLLHRIAIVGVVASAFAAAAAPSQAAVNPPKTLNYTCKFPLVDKQPVEIVIASNIPKAVTPNEPQPPFAIDATVTASGNTWRAIETLGAQAISGLVNIQSSLRYASALVEDGPDVHLYFEQWRRPAGPNPRPTPMPLVFEASGSTPPMVFEESSWVRIAVGELMLNLVAFKANGTPINVKKLTTDVDGNPVPMDTTPDDFNVYCKLDPGEHSVFDAVCALSGGGFCEYPFTEPPSTVAELAVESITATTATLRWAASIDPEGDSVSYNVYRGATKLASVDGTSFEVTGLAPGTTDKLFVEATDGTGVSDRKAVTFTTAPAAVDTTPPTVPGDGVYLPDDVGDTFINVRWGASTDNPGGCGLKGYIVRLEDEEFFVPAGSTSKRFDGLASDTDHLFYIRAVDNCGNESEEHEEFLIGLVDRAPAVPAGVKVDAVSTSTVDLSWGASIDPNGDPVQYRVYRGDTVLATVSGTSYTVIGLESDTRFEFSVDAIDDRGRASQRSLPVPATTAPVLPQTLDYALKGSTSLKTLTKGNLPLTGGIKAVPDFAAGTFVADLTLNNTNGRLIAGGFLPITAKVGFVPAAKTTGTLDDATATTPAGITTNSKVRIKVLEVKLFGAIPLAGGNNCQTKQLSDINLKSTNAFDPFKGGTIAGTYKISDLNGCGALNGIVSPLTAGGGNTIRLDLVYRP